MDTKTGKFRNSRLTADEIKALREKEARAVTYCEMHGSLEHAEMHKKMFDTYDAEFKRRIKHINFPVTEAISELYAPADEKANFDFIDRYESELMDLAQSLKRSGGKGKVPWKKIPATLLRKVWLEYGRAKHIDKDGLNQIADRVLTNIARLRASTEMMGHTSNDVRPYLEDMGVEFTDNQWDVWMSNYFTDNNGAWMLSDYGLPKLEHLYGDIFSAENGEARLHAIDKALNVMHMRSDLAAMFVEGGSSTLRKIFDQGGYTSPEEPEGVRSSSWEWEETVNETGTRRFKMESGGNALEFIGNCRDESLVDSIFGSVSEFSRQVEECGDNFKYRGVVVKYDSNTDIHSFWKRPKPINESEGQSIHFTLSPPDKNNVVGINLNGKRFAQTSVFPPSWGKYGGKWVFNKGGMAIDMKHPGFDKGYNKPEDILPDLEKWYKLQRIQSEGFGSGIPEKDRLKIENTDGSTRRWQVRSKNAPKTPKMTKEEVISIPSFDNPIKSKRMTDDHDNVVRRLEPHDDTS